MINHFLQMLQFSKKDNIKGQAMPYMLVMVVALLISWAMMVNIARLMQERMMLQNAADNAALSAAVSKARLLNKLGQLNYLIGCALYGTEAGLNYHSFGITGGLFGWCLQGIGPADFQFMTDTQEMIGCVFDASHGGCPGTDWFRREYSKLIGLTRNLVYGMIKVQEGLIWQFRYEFANPIRSMNRTCKIAQRQTINSNKENTGADYAYVVNPNSVLLEELVRNENGVNYGKTVSFCISIPPNPYCPPLHIHFFWTEEYKRERKSWLYADKNSFNNNQKITVVAVKEEGSASNKGYPLFSKWLGIKWPTITTVASARVYNRKGPMFPLERKGHPSNKISPVIKAYKYAEQGGWDAHLVPTNYLAVQH